MTKLKQVTTLLLLLIVCLQMKIGAAIKLNLTESCSDRSLYFCTIANLSASYNDPLFVVNASTEALTQLVIRSSALGRVPREVFTLAPNLRVFFMHNSVLSRLQPHDFVDAKQLVLLLLQGNRLSELPEKIFSPAQLLQELHLGSNHIHMVHRSAFAGLSQLRYLDMQSNSVRNLPSDLFAGLINLEHIDLSSNEIEKIDADTFAANVKLHTLLLRDNKFSVFEPNSLEHLPHLHLLDLSNTALDELELRSVDTLLVQNSALKSCVINGSAIKVHAGNNDLTRLLIGDRLAVRELDLHGNLLETFDIDTFAGMSNLQHLDVSQNQIASLSSKDAPPYLMLPSLTYLNLASNQLQNLTTENFLLLQKLLHLDLGFNRLVRLDQRIFETLTNLEKLFIEGNKLSKFEYEEFLHSHVHVREIGLFENDWDARYLRNMIAYLKEVNVQVSTRGVLEWHGTSATTAAMFASTKTTHHHYSTTPKIVPAADTAERAGVSGIHPYWTTRDICAMAILVGVLCILLLQLYTILRDEGCLPLRCCQGAANLTGHNRPQRLHEDDSAM